MNKKKEMEFKPKNSTFSLQRTLAIAFKTINQFRRDRRTLALLTIVPIITMLVFGLALSGEVNNVPIIIENNDELYLGINLGSNITDVLEGDNSVTITYDTYVNGIDLVEKGKSYASILIPANFSQSIAYMLAFGNVTPSFYIYIDATNPTVRASVLGAVREALEESIGDKGINLVQTLAHDGAEFTGLDVGIPAIIAFELIFLLVIVGVITVTREKIQGTQDRLFATPLKSSERLLGYVIGLLLIATIMVALILIFGIFVFGAKVRGNAFLLIFAALLFGLAHVFMSVFLANFAQNELQAIQFAPLTAIPSMALGGLLIPVVGLPVWLQPVSYIVPLTYGINLFEGIMLKGWGFKELWVDFLVVAGMCLIFFVLAVLSVRNRMRD
ncbi:MAG: ABC-2 transporter permease [Candidatus Heimdallarchaeota archaeon]|nr:ABC-2 transporter permease [Candidatus Heimdallarchaeota archaeon]